LNFEEDHGSFRHVVGSLSIRNDMPYMDAWSPCPRCAFNAPNMEVQTNKEDQR